MRNRLFKNIRDLDDLEAMWEPGSADATSAEPRSGIVARKSGLPHVHIPVNRVVVPDCYEIPIEECAPENDDEVPRVYDAVPSDESTGATRMSEVAAQMGRVSRLSSIPRVVWHDVSNLPLDAKSAFMFSRIDGESTVESLLDVCAMSECEAMEALLQLVELGVVAFE